MNGAPESPAERETPGEAARRLAGSALRDGFRPDGLYRYCEQDGTVRHWRIRTKHPDGRKWIRPMRWTGRAYELKEPSPPAGGKLLYWLPALRRAAADALAVVVEGEPCTDALVRLGCLALTSGGGDSARQADWSPLQGRRVVIWPDNDATGMSYAREVAAALRGIAASVEWIDVAALGLPEKGDCVDWLAAHPEATADDVWALARVLPANDTLKDGPDRAASAASRQIDDAPRVILRSASDVVPEPVDWLWPGWLAAGKLHLIGGVPGTGKTTLALGLAAIVTSGGRWPDGTRARAGSAVIWSGEDDNADTLNPRLRVAGAALSRARTIDRVLDGGESYPFDPARDVEALHTALQAVPDVRLIVVDPVSSAVAGDSHKNAEVRRGLQPLVDLAREFRCAVLGITHFSKSTSGRDPLERITGSLAFGALARVVLVAARQQVEDGSPERNVLLRAKSNLGPDDGGFAYALQREPVPDYPHVEASRVVWGEAIEGTARTVLEEAEARGEDMDERRDAASWLRDLLAAGDLPVKEIKRHADDAGHAWRTVQRAMRRAGVESKRGGFGEPALWRLRTSRATSEPVAPLSKAGANGATGATEGADEQGEVP